MRRFYIIVLLVVLGAALAAYLRNQNSVRARKSLDQLQVGGGAHQLAALSNIVKEGDAGYAELSRGLRAEDTLFDKQYDKWRQRLPANLRDQLPARPSRQELRRAIARISNLLGPVGCRAIVPAVEYAVEDSDPITSLELIRTLYWSIPESPRAVRILSNYVAKPSPQKLLLGMSTATEIWRAVPQLAPLMKPWLQFSDQAGEAAEALGAMGTNAAFAVDQLVQVAGHGVAGNPPQFRSHMTYPPDYDLRLRNREKAIRALGQVGSTNASVFSAFEKALIDNDHVLRCNAADGLGYLGEKALPILPFLLEHLDRSNRLVLRYQIDAIGKMGPRATAAIPVLLAFSEKTAVDAVPEQPEPNNRLIRWDSEPLPLPFGAAFALAQIDPERARRSLESLEPLAMALSMKLPEDQVLKLTPLKADLLRVAEPHLKVRRESPFSGYLALNLLRIAPEYAPARALLEQQLSIQTEPIGWIAPLNYFYAFRDTNKVLAIFKKRLASQQAGQSTLQNLAALGPIARPLIPEIQKYLEHENIGLRFSAGSALRAIAPESLPPVKESDE